MPQPVVDVPRELQEALRGDNAAWSASAALSPSHKGEYIKWIMEAKKQETRSRRIAKAIERLAKEATGE